MDKPDFAERWAARWTAARPVALAILAALERFVRWRRESGGWIYFLLAVAWFALTVVIAHATGWGWAVYVTSGAFFLLFFEVGVAYVVSAAWGSHRQIEYEGFITVLISLYKEGLNDDEVCQVMRLTPAALQRLKAQLASGPDEESETADQEP